MRVVPRVYFKLSVPEYILYSGISFYAHGHPKEVCQLELTGVRRAIRGKAFQLLDLKQHRGRTDAELENSISPDDAELENSISPDDAQSIYERMP